MTITEPTTLITDYLLGLMALWLALKLGRRASWERRRVVLLWAAAFVGLATASFAGGTHHGFTEHLGQAGIALTWKITLFAIGIVSFMLFSGATVAAFRGRVRRLLILLASAKFVVYAIWIVNHDDFVVAIADYAPSMLYVLLLQALAWRRGEESGRWIVAGVVVSFLAAGVQQSGLTLHQHFNHNDLYHVIQMAGVYLLYRGGILLADRSTASLLARRPGRQPAVDADQEPRNHR